MSVSRKEKLKSGGNALLRVATSAVPILSNIVGGFDSYQQDCFNKSINKSLEFLENKVENIETLFNDRWLETDNGKVFVQKVFNCIIDQQLIDKQELFVNSLINGINDQKTTILEKLKFVDMLRHLSFASISILYEIYELFKDGKLKSNNTIVTHCDISGSILTNLITKFDKYLVDSAFLELKSQGVFSTLSRPKEGSTSGWVTQNVDSYTEFTERFIKFIQEPFR